MELTLSSNPYTTQNLLSLAKEILVKVEYHSFITDLSQRQNIIETIINLVTTHVDSRPTLHQLIHMLVLVFMYE